MLPGKKDEPTHGLKAGLFFGLIAALGQGGGAVLSRIAYQVAQEAGHPFHGAGDGVNAAYQRLLGGLAVTILFWLYLKITIGTGPSAGRTGRRVGRGWRPPPWPGRPSV